MMPHLEDKSFSRYHEKSVSATIYGTTTWKTRLRNTKMKEVFFTLFLRRNIMDGR